MVEVLHGCKWLERSGGYRKHLLIYVSTLPTRLRGFFDHHSLMSESTALGKRGRDGAEPQVEKLDSGNTGGDDSPMTDEDSDDDVGPMPMPEGEAPKKKRKGEPTICTPLIATYNIFSQFFHMSAFSWTIYHVRTGIRRASCIAMLSTSSLSQSRRSSARYRYDR